MHDDTWIWLDGDVVPAAEARVPVLDRGFLYGDSIFEVTRTAGRVPLLFDAHLERLERSAAALGIAAPCRSEIEQAALAAIARVKAPECYLRIIVTRGAGPMDLDPAAADVPRLLAIARPLRLPDPGLYRDGVAVATVSERRNGSGLVLAAVKSSNYLSSVLALRAARERGAYEALMCDPSGCISEGASSNFFSVAAGQVHTPPLSLGLLAGVTRAAVMDLAGAAGTSVVETPFGVEAALAADEAFLTSSIRGILPVVRLDGKAIGSGRPGPVTRLLMERYRERYLERNSSASPTSNSKMASPR